MVVNVGADLGADLAVFGFTPLVDSKASGSIDTRWRRAISAQAKCKTLPCKRITNPFAVGVAMPPMAWALRCNRVVSRRSSA